MLLLLRLLLLRLLLLLLHRLRLRGSGTHRLSHLISGAFGRQARHVAEDRRHLLPHVPITREEGRDREQACGGPGGLQRRGVGQ